MTVEPKGIDSFETRNCLRVIIAGNDDKLITAAGDERRYVIIDVSGIHKEDHDYFNQLAQWRKNAGLSALLYHLMHYDFKDVNLRSAPRNDALLAIKLNSLGPVQEWWYGCLCEGMIYPGRPWGRISAAELHSRYSESIGSYKDRSTETKFGVQIRKLVPGLKKERFWIKEIRQSYYLFPTLDECRKDFDFWIGHEIEWPDESADI